MPRTNLGSALEVKCIDCFRSVQPWCYKCTNKVLRNDIYSLQCEIAYLKKEFDAQFEELPTHHYLTYLKRHLSSQDTFELTSNTHFFTITFDPSRFKNLGSNTSLEEIYILNQLSYFVKNKTIHDLYGSFELTKDGITHAHVNIKTYNPVELKRSLKERFTFNPQNRYAIHSGTANSKSMGYIDKIEEGKGTENKTWFTLKKETDYGLDYMPEEHENKYTYNS